MQESQPGHSHKRDRKRVLLPLDLLTYCWGFTRINSPRFVIFEEVLDFERQQPPFVRSVDSC